MGHNHFCEVCGRDVDRDYACLHQKRISKIEVMIIYVMIILLPIVLIPSEILTSSYTWDMVLPTSALSMIIVLSILTLGNIVFNRPYLALFFGCHQKIERSPVFFHRVWVLCSRCTGIYVGIMWMVMSFWMVFAWWIYVLFAIPLIIDGVLQQKGIRSSTTLSRWLTGFLFGFFLTFVFNIMIYGIMVISEWIVGLL